MNTAAELFQSMGQDKDADSALWHASRISLKAGDWSGLDELLARLAKPLSQHAAANNHALLAVGYRDLTFDQTMAVDHMAAMTECYGTPSGLETALGSQPYAVDNALANVRALLQNPGEADASLVKRMEALATELVRLRRKTLAAIESMLAQLSAPP